MRIFMTCLAAALIMLASAAAARADVVQLRGGDKLSGTILLLKDPAALRFHTNFGQTLYIPWGEVVGLYNANGQTVHADYFSSIAYTTIPYIDSHNVSTKGFTPYNGPQDMKAVLISPEFAPDYAALHEEAKALRAKMPKTAKKADKLAGTQPAAGGMSEAESLWGAIWSGRANLGASIQAGNSEKDAIDADLGVKAKWGGVHRAGLEAEYNREKDDGDVTEDNKSIEGMYDYFFREKWFVNSHLGFEQDEIQEIDLRTTLGAGIGHQVYERDNLNLQYVLGPAYLRTEFEDGSDEDSIAASWSFDYDQKVLDDALQLFHNHGLLIPTDDADAYLFDSKTGLRIPLKMGLVGTAEVDFDWDNDPQPGIEEDDTKYALKLGYEW